MGKRDAFMPDHIATELKARDYVIVGSVYKTGSNHWAVQFTKPGFGTARWQWPKLDGKSDPRAMLNNRSQLRNFLRVLECQMTRTSSLPTLLARGSKTNINAL